MEMGGDLVLPLNEGLNPGGSLTAPPIAGLEDVRDNAPFRREDVRPWFELLGVLHNASLPAIQSQSFGRTMAVQLLEQPEAYRGRLVTVEGTARQSIPYDLLGSEPTSADLWRLSLIPGLEFPSLAARSYLTRSFLSNYHRIVVTQDGASVPVVVFTLDLPADFPKGESLAERVSVTGYYFKNWLFPSGDGIGVGPILLAKGIDWERNQAAPAAILPANSHDVWFVLCAATGLSIAATWWLWRRSRGVDAAPSRRASSRPATPDFSSLRSFPPQGGEAYGGPS
jgi:hypothetical protein